MQQHHDQLGAVERLNFVQLTPVSFLRRTASVYPEHASVIHGKRRYTWRQTEMRCRQLARGLQGLGVARGDTVSLLAANTPELIEAHYGVPMSGGVLNTINTRLDADTVADILQHADAKVLICDTHFSPVTKQALAQLKKNKAALPIVIDIIDGEFAPPEGAGETLGKMDYEALLASGEASSGDEDFMPPGEWDALALNYTSGTSGKPKGVVYHHRGGYLMALGTIAAWQVPKHPVYLYTVPLFHCNGWGHVWTMCVMAGTMICNRTISAEVIFDAITTHRVTHFGAAPIILSMLANAPPETQPKLDYTLQVMTAGAPPPSKVLEKTAAMGFNVTHVYGLTETYGHVIYCDWQREWDSLDAAEQAELKARQGVRLPMMEDAQVLDVKSGKPVVADGKSIGEIALRGNTTMKGYYKNPEVTAEAFRGDWFRSGDLAVVHADGYIEIKDRLKDIIISGGENISSIEVESVLYKHPKVAGAAVVAKPDEKWGETPCAFVELKDAADADEDELIAFCKDNMAGFKRPKQIVFMTLPKTSTGKIQKFKLRAMVRDGEV